MGGRREQWAGSGVSKGQWGSGRDQAPEIVVLEMMGSDMLGT